jgi:hypothetical protein
MCPRSTSTLVPALRNSRMPALRLPATGPSLPSHPDSRSAGT